MQLGYKKIKDVVGGVNDLTSKIANSVKMNELDMMFKDEAEPIYNKKRELYF